jgi:glycerophosphoryl diester phosphodiesterase
MLVLAHRGASAQAPENTLAAFALARALGADGVELDVRRAGDRLVVHHDPLPPGPLPADVPTLAEALDACAGLLVNVEVKTDGLPALVDRRVAAESVIHELRRRTGDRVLLSSFDLAALDAARDADPTVPTAWLVVEAGRRTLDVLAAHGHAVLHPRHDGVDGALVAEAHRRGITVNVWTCDDAARIVELAGWGVDGVITNVPDVARRALGRS